MFGNWIMNVLWSAFMIIINVTTILLFGSIMSKATLALGVGLIILFVFLIIIEIVRYCKSDTKESPDGENP